jgi:hypothetical protein
VCSHRLLWLAVAEGAWCRGGACKERRGQLRLSVRWAARSITRGQVEDCRGQVEGCRACGRLRLAGGGLWGCRLRARGCMQDKRKFNQEGQERCISILGGRRISLRSSSHLTRT